MSSKRKSRAEEDEEEKEMVEATEEKKQTKQKTGQEVEPDMSPDSAQLGSDGDSDEGEAIDDEEEDAEDEEDMDQEILVNFEAYPPIESDLEGMRRLLKQIFLKERVNVTLLTELLIQQKDLCTVITQQEEDEDQKAGDADKEPETDVYGISSVVDLSGHSEGTEKGAVEQLNAYLVDHCKDSMNDALIEIVTNAGKKLRLGLIINERYVNLSPKICLPSLEQLVADMKKDATCRFDYYLMITKILRAKVRPEEGERKGKQSGKHSTRLKEQIIYLNPEEELFDETSDLSFEFDVSDQCDGDTRGGHWDDDDEEYQPMRRVLLFTSASFTKALDKIKAEFA